MSDIIDLTTKTCEQLLARLAQLEKVADREGRAGERFVDLFEVQYNVQRQINLILIEIARRKLTQP